MDVAERETMARAILDGNGYMTLGTADAHGLPWASPVWYAPASYREFFWVSKPGARHSQNIAVRPDVGIVIFDSTVPISTGKAVYLAARAEQVTTATEIERRVRLLSAVARAGRPRLDAGRRRPGRAPASIPCDGVRAVRLVAGGRAAAVPPRVAAGSAPNPTRPAAAAAARTRDRRRMSGWSVG
jgi:hypothetical protein